MLSVKVLGPGCANCDRLMELAMLALEEITAEYPDTDATVEKVTDTAQFLDYGLLHTPGLVINEKLVSSGKIPTPGKIAGWMREALEDAG